jgi:NADH dehydrogenase FAD-containing subunit
VLVLAFGSRANDFGTPGVVEHCHFIDSQDQADSFNKSCAASSRAATSTLQSSVAALPVWS